MSVLIAPVPIQSERFFCLSSAGHDSVEQVFSRFFRIATMHDTTMTPLHEPLHEVDNPLIPYLGGPARLQIWTLTLVAVNSAKLLLFSSLSAVRANFTTTNGCPDIGRLDLTYCMRYGDVIVSPFSFCLGLNPAYSTGLFILAPLFPTLVHSHGN